LLAQGLYYAAHHLGSAYLLAGSDVAAAAAFWDGFDGLVVQQLMQATTLLIGGLIAGAGQRHGLAVGATVGVLSAALTIGMKLMAHEWPNDLILYGQPILLPFVGAVGGLIGSRVWQPAPELPPFTGDGRQGQEVLTTVLPEQPSDTAVEPLPWGRMLVGTAVAVGGTLGARLIRELILLASGGTGHEMQQSQFITWEIAVVAQVMGGGIAGANTRGGAVYGFWVGLLAAALLPLGRSMAGARFQAHEVSAWLLGLSVPEGSPAALFIQGVQVLVLATLGGWLGSLTLPAVLPRRTSDAAAR
jgi:hypothetical protein